MADKLLPGALAPGQAPLHQRLRDYARAEINGNARAFMLRDAIVADVFKALADPQQAPGVSEASVVAWRYKHPSSPGMIGHYPWSYVEQKPKRQHAPDDIEALVRLKDIKVGVSEADARDGEKRTYPAKLYTKSQREWCERYERETTFEPLMCDYEAGNMTFVEAARNSTQWFESWASDALRRGCDDIPGALDQLYAEIGSLAAQKGAEAQPEGKTR